MEMMEKFGTLEKNVEILPTSSRINQSVFLAVFHGFKTLHELAIMTLENRNDGQVCLGWMWEHVFGRMRQKCSHKGVPECLTRVFWKMAGHFIIWEVHLPKC